MTTAFVFPGQGSQKVGMGQELYNNYDVARKIMDEADAALNIDLKKLCFEGPMEELTLTHNVQPAITTINMMALAVMNEKGIKSSIIAGHSLGEYSALAAAGVITPIDAIKLTAVRGECMQKCADLNPGAMSAILGLAPEEIIKELAKITDKGVIQVANFNSKTQSVISGTKEAVEVANDNLKAAGARRVVPLPVSGPWHSPLVGGAVEELAAALEAVQFVAPTTPLVQNVPGTEVTDATEIKANLKAQVTGSVQWVDTMQLFLDKGIETVTEVGPGNVLQGLAKQANRGWKFQSYTAELD